MTQATQPEMYASLMTDMVGARMTPDVGAYLAARHGFPGLDLRLNAYADFLDTFGVERFADLLEERGIRPGYVSITTRTLSASDGEWAEMMRLLPERAKTAQRLGYTRAGVVMLPFDDERDTAANHRRHVVRIRQVAPVLADHDIRLGVEYVAPVTRRRGHPHPFIHNMRGTLRLLHDAGQPNVGLMLDTLHWATAGESVEDIEALEADQVVVVHVCDGIRGRAIEAQTVHERELPGATGVYDNAGFIEALRTIGYTGPVTAEPSHPRWASTDPELAVAQTARAVLDTLCRTEAPQPES
ncbi:sugar phosphate isomerase/epimerase family protein [Mucisphaera calidilacus]|uniref:sugar phosphate isomerase/epimerase family protein n=1 Tax=Mucisphaera calidilacus TaxID=2527982 RepID=UPI001F436A0C|nr:sugar phosphate isomerase/epimerase [Mucisphaera calidilacus]